MITSSCSCSAIPSCEKHGFCDGALALVSEVARSRAKSLSLTTGIMSQEKKMNALKELATILKEKGTPAPELWKAGGFPAPKRLKDVEQAIVALRKTFSVDAKARDAEEERTEAEAAGLSIEELREQNKKKRVPDHQQDKRQLDTQRKEGREAKVNVSKLAQGEFDLQTDFVGGDD